MFPGAGLQVFFWLHCVAVGGLLQLVLLLQEGLRSCHSLADSIVRRPVGALKQQAQTEGAKRQPCTLPDACLAQGRKSASTQPGFSGRGAHL